MSFNGNKIATCGGGGAYVTSDAAAAARVRHLTTQAKVDTRRFVHDEAGWNYRLTNVAAAIGLAQLEQLAGFIAAKRACHDALRRAARRRAGHRRSSARRRGPHPNYWFHSVLVDEDAFGRDREGLMGALAEQGIETRPVWGLLHEQAPAARLHGLAHRAGAAGSGGACSTCRARATSGRGDVERVAAAIRADEEDGLVDDRVRDDRRDDPATPSATALRRMDESGGRMVLVTDDDDTLRGVATDGDMRRWIIAGRGARRPLSGAMNAQPHVLEQGYRRETAEQLMSEGRFECLPVVDRAGTRGRRRLVARPDRGPARHQAPARSACPW